VAKIFEVEGQKGGERERERKMTMVARTHRILRTLPIRLNKFGLANQSAASKSILSGETQRKPTE